MTRKEFEKRYAKNKGMTVKELRNLGRVAVSCYCGDKNCHGWQSRMKIDVDLENSLKG